MFKKNKKQKMKMIILSNVATGVHGTGNVTFTAAAATTSKHIFGKLTGTQGQIALSGSSNTSTGARAIGILTDEADNAGDPVNVALIGAANGTMRVLANGTINVGDYITADSTSQAISFANQPASATYYVYGIALTAGGAGDRVEFVATPGLTMSK